jgi:uncharacterized protein YegL
MRRLPVYLLLDCSSSMTGAPIIAVNEGLELLYRELMKDPQTRETAWISLIRFASKASQDALVPVDQFVPPTLTASGGTAMGGAFHILAQSIKQDLVASGNGVRGDYRPLVFLLTDGQPGDDWHTPLNELNSLRGSQKPTFIALGCGDGVDGAMLAQVTPNVFLMANVQPDALKAFFKLISGSIVSASRAAGANAGEVNMPSPENVPGVVKYSL